MLVRSPSATPLAPRSIGNAAAWDICRVTPGNLTVSSRQPAPRLRGCRADAIAEVAIPSAAGSRRGLPGTGITGSNQPRTTPARFAGRRDRRADLVEARPEEG